MAVTLASNLHKYCCAQVSITYFKMSGPQVTHNNAINGRQHKGGCSKTKISITNRPNGRDHSGQRPGFITQKRCILKFSVPSTYEQYDLCGYSKLNFIWRCNSTTITYNYQITASTKTQKFQFMETIYTCIAPGYAGVYHYAGPT